MQARIICVEDSCNHNELEIKCNDTDNGWIFVSASAWKNPVRSAISRVEMLLSPCALKSLNTTERIQPQMIYASFDSSPCTLIVFCYSSTNSSYGRILSPSIGMMVRVIANGLGDLGPILGRVISKTLKWYLMHPCLTLNIIRYGSRVKRSNPGKGVAPSPTPWCCSYRKGSLRVTLDFICSPSHHRTSNAQGLFKSWSGRRVAAHTRPAKSENTFVPVGIPSMGMPQTQGKKTAK